MVNFQSKIIVHSPIHKTFDWFVHEDAMKIWLEPFQRKVLLHGDHLEEGSKHRLVSNTGDHLHKELTNFSIYNQYSYVLDHPNKITQASVLFSAVDTGTQIEMNINAQGKGLHKYMLPLFSKKLQLDQQRKLKNFKSFLESKWGE